MTTPITPAVPAADPTAPIPITSANSLSPESIAARIATLRASGMLSPEALAGASAPAAPVAGDPEPVAAPAPVAGEPAVVLDGDAGDAGEPLDAGDVPAGDTEVEAPALQVVALPARRPGEVPLEIEVDSPEVAERLRQMERGYLRNEDYKSKMAAVDRQAQEFREFEVMLQADPISVVDVMPVENQLNIARLLIAQHFDALAPDLERLYADPAERKMLIADTMTKRGAAKVEFEERAAVVQWAESVKSAIGTLIPDGVAEADAAEFYDDARRYLASVSEQRTFRASEVPALLATRLARYGWPANTAPAQPKADAPKTAAAPAGRPAALPPESEEAKAKRLTAVAKGRAVARASVPNVGTGAAASIPRPPKGLSIEETAKFYQRLAAQSGSAPRI